VEGAEVDVLHGARGLLADARPVVVFESWAGSPERRELFDLLTALDYGVHEPVPGPGPALERARFLAAPSTNFVARPLLAGQAPRRAATAGLRAAPTLP
jgi:hypothetical protein